MEPEVWEAKQEPAVAVVVHMEKVETPVTTMVLDQIQIVKVSTDQEQGLAMAVKQVEMELCLSDGELVLYDLCNGFEKQSNWNCCC